MGYKLIPVDFQITERHSYRNVLEEFMVSSYPSVLVEKPEINPASLAIGLRRAVAVGGFRVKVAFRKGNVYIIKTKSTRSPKGKGRSSKSGTSLQHGPSAVPGAEGSDSVKQVRLTNGGQK